jgi:membrane dipeptidase
VCIAAHAGFLHPADIRGISVPTIELNDKRDRRTLDERLRMEHRAALQAVNFRHATLANLADHIEHAVRVAGIDHVAIGSDFDGGITAPSGFEDISCRPHLAFELLQRGYHPDEIQRVFGLNLVSLLERVQSGGNGTITN